jgi:long-chain acyl-CoA synthetase
MGEHDRMLSYLPLAHVVERVLVEHGWLRTGMRVYFAESLETFAADLQRAVPTIFFSVPRLWVKFQQGVHHKMPAARLDRLLAIPIIGALVRRKILKALGLDQCEFAAGGAAPMPVALLAWYRKLGLPVNEGYGMTENLALSHLTLPGRNQEGTVGPVYDGVQARIDAPTGEIQMRSAALMLGYYREPELTSQAFTADGWLRTGDKGQIDAEGRLTITGRLKDLFKTSKGKYVAPAPIEDKLVMHDAVEACVVSGANLGQPLGIVMLNAETLARIGEPAARAELEASLAQHLATHPAVAAVHYPGLPCHPQHALAQRLFAGGSSWLLSFELKDASRMVPVLNRLRLPIKATGLGDTRSLVIPVAPTIFWEMGAAARADMGIADGMVRYSVGLEEPQDLLDDLDQALELAR